MLTYAHRANGFGHLENSPAAIKAACAQGFCVEIDLRLTKDGKWTVLHDAYLDRISTSKGLVAEHTAAALKKLTLIDGQPIPLLDDILPLFKKTDNQLLIELKSGGQERALIDTLKRHKMLHRTTLATWNPRTLETLRDLDHNVRTCLFYFPAPRLLALLRWHLHLRYDGDHLYVGLNKHGAFPAHLHGALIHSHIPKLPIDAIGVPALLIRPPLIRESRSRGIDIIAFGANNARQTRQLNVHGIVTDRPATFKR